MIWKTFFFFLNFFFKFVDRHAFENLCGFEITVYSKLIHVEQFCNLESVLFKRERKRREKGEMKEEEEDHQHHCCEKEDCSGGCDKNSDHEEDHEEGGGDAGTEESAGAGVEEWSAAG